MILVATVRHTGTMALLNTLGPHRPIEDGTDERVQFCHLHDSLVPMIAAWSGKIITTYRPLEKVVASWRSRGEDLQDLFRQWANWEQLIVIKQPEVVIRWR